MSEHKLIKRNCPICNSDNAKNIGIRGNREYNGADQFAEPHIFTNVVRCKVCDFIYTNPEIRGLEYLETNHYNDPDNYMKEMEATAQHDMFEKRIDIIKNHISTDQNTMLDIGAGKGEFLQTAMKAGFLAMGIEPSAKFSEFGKTQLHVNISQGLLGEVTAIEGKTFDIVVMNHVLEHVENPVSLLNKIHKYLNPNGVLFIEVPNCNSYLNQLADLFFRFKGLRWSSRLSPLHPPFHKFGYTPKSMLYLLKTCNYRLINRKTFSGKDRASFSKRGWKYRAAAMFSLALGLIGNRELLCVLAAKASQE